MILGHPSGPLPGLLAAAALAMASALPAHAETCAAEAVTARGEQARFEWLAKTKARANWRRKVRLAAGLGPAYANWAKARDTEERCIEVQGRTYCIFTGTPCRP